MDWSLLKLFLFLGLVHPAQILLSSPRIQIDPLFSDSAQSIIRDLATEDRLNESDGLTNLFQTLSHMGIPVHLVSAVHTSVGTHFVRIVCAKPFIRLRTEYGEFIVTEGKKICTRACYTASIVDNLYLVTAPLSQALSVADWIGRQDTCVLSSVSITWRTANDIEVAGVFMPCMVRLRVEQNITPELRYKLSSVVEQELKDRVAGSYCCDLRFAGMCVLARVLENKKGGL